MSMLFSQQLHPFILSLHLCIYMLDINDHSKHIVCFISSEISMYLTKIPELSTNCMCMFILLSTNEMLNLILSDIKAVEYNKRIITTFISGKLNMKKASASQRS